ncbi:hypothetical protein N9Y79_00555 [Alphaproteobacteria bacterium]|nr:hypothetical protein [Alphaproteobacteria bacterium]MDB2641014.1 hypothetical protein [Alphaproteobacteria bacterium]
MSAAIVSYESFKAKREQRPQEYFAYIDMLQEAYPELIKAECEEAVEQWFTQKDALSERLWADCEYINCAIKVPVWESTVPKIKARFIPTGIVFRAAFLSNRNLMMTFAYELQGEDNDYFEVWHAPAKDLGAIEELAVQVAQETLDENPDDENSDGIINYSYLYSEERLDALRLANSNIEKWITKESISRRYNEKKVSSEPPFSMLSKEEQLLFTDEDEFNEWIAS